VTSAARVMMVKRVLASRRKKLRPVLSLFDATAISIGSIIGAGIFVIIGVSAGLSGPSVVLSVILALAASMLTAITMVQLSGKVRRSGGVYAYAREGVSHFAGFIVGWLWVASNVTAGATVALGFAHYLNAFFPVIPITYGALSAAALIILVNLAGMKDSSRLNNVLVVLKVLILLFFAIGSFFFFKPGNFVPFMPKGIPGMLAGAAVIMFAFGGFARVAVVSDEVKNAKRNVPKAILISLIISAAIYVLVALAAVGAVGYERLSASASPLADVMDFIGLPWGASLVAIGALIATLSVLLGSVLGVSRVIFEMANDCEIPSGLGSVGRKTCTPYASIIATGVGIVLLVIFSNLLAVAYFSSFAMLFYYIMANLAGMRLLKDRFSSRIIAGLGCALCGVLLFTFPLKTWLTILIVVLAGIVYRFLMKQPLLHKMSQ